MAKKAITFVIVLTCFGVLSTLVSVALMISIVVTRGAELSTQQGQVEDAYNSDHAMFCRECIDRASTNLDKVFFLPGCEDSILMEDQDNVVTDDGLFAFWTLPHPMLFFIALVSVVLFVLRSQTIAKQLYNGYSQYDRRYRNLDEEGQIHSSFFSDDDDGAHSIDSHGVHTPGRPRASDSKYVDSESNSSESKANSRRTAALASEDHSDFGDPNADAVFIPLNLQSLRRCIQNLNPLWLWILAAFGIQISASSLAAMAYTSFTTGDPPCRVAFEKTSAYQARFDNNSPSNFTYSYTDLLWHYSFSFVISLLLITLIARCSTYKCLKRISKTLKDIFTKKNFSFGDGHGHSHGPDSECPLTEEQHRAIELQQELEERELESQPTPCLTHVFRTLVAIFLTVVVLIIGSAAIVVLALILSLLVRANGGAHAISVATLGFTQPFNTWLFSTIGFLLTLITGLIFSGQCCCLKRLAILAHAAPPDTSLVTSFSEQSIEAIQ